jgi:hypothetical protein
VTRTMKLFGKCKQNQDWSTVDAKRLNVYGPSGTRPLVGYAVLDNLGPTLTQSIEPTRYLIRLVVIGWPGYRKFTLR